MGLLGEVHCYHLVVKILKIYSDNEIFIEVETSQIPWLKIFTQHPYKELSQVDTKLRYKLFDTLNIIEKEMLCYYTPTKINIASFGNYLPQVHFHIMARFEDDQFFPEPMWGKPQRYQIDLSLPPLETFILNIQNKLQ